MKSEPAPGMRPTTLLREALVSAVARPVPTAMVAILVAATCLVTLLTVGRTAGAEAQVRERLDSAGARMLVITDIHGQGLLNGALVASAASLSTVESSFGVASPLDVVSTAQGRGGTRTPMWQLVGDLETAVALTSGRWPERGEAIVGEAAAAGLGLDGPVGSVEAGMSYWPVVGTYIARDSFSELDDGVLVPAESGTARTLYVVATSADVAAKTQSQMIALIAPLSLADLSVQSPTTLADLQADVGADLGAFGRNLLVLVLAAGAGLSAVVVFADVLVRRADLGRRRALGATRRALGILITVRTLIPALVGAAVGTAAGAVVAAQWGTLPPRSFLAGTAVLSVLAATASAIPPAVIAARSDPVRVLRTA